MCISFSDIVLRKKNLIVMRSEGKENDAVSDDAPKIKSKIKPEEKEPKSKKSS